MRAGRSLGAAVGAAAVATMVVLAPAGPARADQEVSLGRGFQPTLAADYSTQACAEGTDPTDPRMADRGDHQDGWHFHFNGSFVRLTVTFAPDGAPATDPADHVLVTGEPGDPASPIVFYTFGPNAFTQDAYVFVPAGWLLVDATAVVAPGGRTLTLRTCPGEPETGPDPTPTPTSEPSPAPTGPPGATPAPPTATTPPVTPGLAATGLPTVGLVLLGAGLLAAGTALLVIRRRRSYPI